MGYEELIASLRAEGEEKITEIRDEARAEAEKIQAAADDEITRLREEFREKQFALGRHQEEHLLSSAENKARTIRLKAEQALSERLFRLAMSCLKELRNNDYEKVFGSLCGELPPVSWDEAAVHPDDERLARTHFPGAAILTDPSINGGIEVFRGNRGHHIINTFTKRLERAWDEILPLIVDDVRKETLKHGTSSGQ